MNLKRSKYTGVDFEFKPYSFETVKKRRWFLGKIEIFIP